MLMEESYVSGDDDSLAVTAKSHPLKMLSVLKCGHGGSRRGRYRFFDAAVTWIFLGAEVALMALGKATLCSLYLLGNGTVWMLRFGFFSSSDALRSAPYSEV